VLEFSDLTLVLREDSRLEFEVDLKLVLRED